MTKKKLSREKIRQKKKKKKKRNPFYTCGFKELIFEECWFRFRTSVGLKSFDHVNVLLPPDRRVASLLQLAYKKLNSYNGFM